MTKTFIPNAEHSTEIVAAYAKAFGQLTQASIYSELAPLLAEDIYFEDPFNQLHGKTRTLQLFAHMFATVQQPKFIVSDCALGNPSMHTAYLYWQFHFVYKGQSQQFDGMSKILINQNGLIYSHIDYWNPAKNLYSKIPVLGWILSKINRKLALPDNWQASKNTD
ncbi:hypothetical protein THMIRHAS_21670 [Thiosulfatimonas sediminis]|uniref:SnoaL-like domain-containing protein n=1 Tax=Thiosulfatimonas sediminis TaxID=2675054 RepID=A0A6F8PXS0_9GAMM|nr:nuclear transport factor 2 family protein [Thiosulfatimonas sediminis]BBP46794.1 hypothetical protein THMIRHAS_21670 [Thiosulfatimonas sediminis]